METKTYKTIEDRLDQIETDLRQIKSMLAGVLKSKSTVTPKEYESLMNAKDVSRFLKVDIASIYSACTKNELKFVKVGKLYKFKKDDVMTWAENSSTQMQSVDEYVKNYLKKNIIKS